MPRKKTTQSLYITTIIEREQHERLRELAFANRATMAESVREALDQYLKSRTNKRKVPAKKK